VRNAGAGIARADGVKIYEAARVLQYSTIYKTN